MATNPNNAIGTNAAYGGRTSPKAFNDVLSAFNGRGILSGWQVAPNSGMTIALGGDGDNRDVAIAEDNAGNMTTVNNITGSPVPFTIAAAPASQSRIDAIVVYVNNPPQGISTATDNYGAIGILDVQGTVASTPTKPNDSDIRTAITADGASGATAYYVVLGYVTIPNGTTTITSNLIEQGKVVVSNIVSNDIIDGIVTTDKIASSAVTTNKIASNAVTNAKLANNAVTTSTIANNAVTPKKASFTTYSTTEQPIGTWINGSTVYRVVIQGVTTTSFRIVGTLSGWTSSSKVVNVCGSAKLNDNNWVNFPRYASNNWSEMYINNSNGDVYIRSDVANVAVNIVIEYTKD